MSAVAAALEAFAQGGIVIVTDDAGREDEGDMIVAGSLCSTEAMAFLIRHGCGIVCAPVSAAIADRLALPAMVSVNDAPLATAFTVSVDLRARLCTGISATERAATVRALADPGARSADFVRPGHMFPLRGHLGGLDARQGHTEAALALCGLAGLPEVAAICELFHDDGRVMRGVSIAAFAQSHGLPLIEVDALRAHASARTRRAMMA